MLLKGFKRNLTAIEYDPDGKAVVMAYDFGAHVVMSPLGVELFEVVDGKLQNEPSLVNPEASELMERLREMKEVAK